jgi:hypothetical protein
MAKIVNQRFALAKLFLLILLLYSFLKVMADYASHKFSQIQMRSFIPDREIK